MKELFKDKEYCYSQIREAREIFGNKNTKQPQYEAMEKALAFGYLYCPDEIKELFIATMYEAEVRKQYYSVHIWA